VQLKIKGAEFSKLVPAQTASRSSWFSFFVVYKGLGLGFRFCYMVLLKIFLGKGSSCKLPYSLVEACKFGLGFRVCRVLF